MRETVSGVVAQYGLAIIAASSHPFARWDRQKQTQKERYVILARDMQAVVWRLMISGMHVHVGIEDEELRIADFCTSVDDPICIAAIYRCWSRMLYRLQVKNQRWRTYAPSLIKEDLVAGITL